MLGGTDLFLAFQGRDAGFPVPDVAAGSVILARWVAHAAGAESQLRNATNRATKGGCCKALLSFRQGHEGRAGAVPQPAIAFSMWITFHGACCRTDCK